MSQSMDFFSQYCGVPAPVPVKVITQKDVNEYIKDTITDICQDLPSKSFKVVKITFPSKFNDFSNTKMFWEYCQNFLSTQMKFSQIKTLPDFYTLNSYTNTVVSNYNRPKPVYEGDYNSMPLQHFYTITQKEEGRWNEWYMQDYVTNQNDIDMIVFRIYKA